MSDHEMISRREADEKLEVINKSLERIEKMLQLALDRSGAQAIQIALLEQKVGAGDKWRFIIGAAAISALAMGLANRFFK